MRGIALNSDQYAVQNLASAPLSAVFSFGKRYKLDQILIKFSQSVYETVSIVMVSKNGSNYNEVLDSQTLGGESNYSFRPTGEANFSALDSIQVQCTNANLLGTAYVTCKTSQLGSGQVN